MEDLMARWVDGFLADWEVRWTVILMPLGWKTDWIYSFVDGSLIRFLCG